MKKYSSVLALASRATFYKIMLVLFFMAAVEVAVFYVSLPNPDNLGTFEDAIDESHIVWICAAAFAVISIILAVSLSDHGGSCSSYTIKRLSIDEKSFAALCSLYNICCFILLTAIQVLTALILCYLYIRRNTAEPYSPVIFLAFYRSGFLHGLLPLGDLFGLIRNIIVFACLGVVCAYPAVRQFRNWQYMVGAILAGCIGLSFPRSYGDFGVFQGFIVPIVCILIVAIRHITKGADTDEA